MIKEALMYLMSLAVPAMFEVEGRKYASKKLDPVIPPPVEHLTVHSLKGLLDYYEILRAENGEEKFTFCVQSPLCVQLLGSVDPKWGTRKLYAVAMEPVNDFGEYPDFFNHYVEQKQFIVNLNTWFAKTEDRDKLITFVSSVNLEESTSSKDDGFTQEVATKKGARLGSEKIPNPVTLAPYRTFRELEQVESQFLVRHENGRFALYDCAGQTWKIEAMESIKAHLDLNLEVRTRTTQEVSPTVLI